MSEMLGLYKQIKDLKMQLKTAVGTSNQKENELSQEVS